MIDYNRPWGELAQEAVFNATNRLRDIRVEAAIALSQSDELTDAESAMVLLPVALPEEILRATPDK